VAVSTDGTVFVADTFNKRVQKFIPVEFQPEAAVVNIVTCEATSSVADSTADSGDRSMRRYIRYSGDKAFDGNPVTAWAEGVDGAGIDEGLTLEIDEEITVDEVGVMPGYFDERYFYSNNRVKTLVTVLDEGEIIGFDFADEMVPQRIPLEKQVTFSKAHFSYR
jgi:hypothetical protein